MFAVEYLYKFLLVNLGPNGAMQTRQRKFMLTTMTCFKDMTALYPEISDAPRPVETLWC